MTDEDQPEGKVRWSPAGKIRLCPRCLNPLTQISSISGWLTPSYYKCDACGYSGPVGLEATGHETEGEDDEEQ